MASPVGAPQPRVDAADIVARLVSVGVVDAAAVVDGGFTASDVSRSNQVLVIEPDHVVVKVGLPERLGDQGSAVRERALLRVLAGRSGDLPVPTYVWSDEEMVVTARVRPGDSIADRRHGGGWTDEPLLFGRAVAQWHHLPDELVHELSADVEVPRRPPWVLGSLGDDPPPFVSADQHMSALRDLLLADDAIVEALAAARRAWAGDTWLHGDVRWDNALVESVDGVERVVLVDWEFVDRGDPAWDVAGGLADALIDAVRTGDVGADDAPAATAAIGPYAQRFLSGYRSVTGTPPRLDPALVAARLVQAGFQHVAWQGTDVETGRELAELAGHVVRTPPAW